MDIRVSYMSFITITRIIKFYKQDKPNMGKRHKNHEFILEETNTIRINEEEKNDNINKSESCM